MHLMKLEQKISDCESHRKQEIFKLGLDMMYNLKIEGLTVTMADLLIYLATKYSTTQRSTEIETLRLLRIRIISFALSDDKRT